MSDYPFTTEYVLSVIPDCMAASLMRHTSKVLLMKIMRQRYMHAPVICQHEYIILHVYLL